MASLFTNASAQTALQTLSKASKSLSATQNRVSTGYRINTAEDNAAYWSIATTLRSDVGALGAVKDALGLGAATIDTVYTGINDTKDLLDQIKSKLVAASQTGVPRAQVQAEISQLQNRLADVSKSTVINSETWLTQDSSVEGYSANKNIVGSFTRAGGVVTIENITIDIRQTKLYENSAVTQAAVTSALDDDSAGPLYDYTLELIGPNAVRAIGVAQWGTNVGDVSSDVQAGLGIPATVAIQASKATLLTAIDNISTADVRDDFQAALTSRFGAIAGPYIWNLLDDSVKSNLIDDIDALQVTYRASVNAIAAAGQAGPPVVNPGDLTTAEANTANAARATFINGVNGLFTALLDRNDIIDLANLSGANKARAAYETIAKGDFANSNLGIFDKVRTVTSNEDGTGARAVRVSDIDISKLTDTTFDKGILTAYLTAVDDALQELTLSASIVGAAKARIEGNKTFVQNLIDANNRGIGQLVDADLNEESSKLKALQVQEQLSIQALSIANNSTQNILSLFQ